VHFSSTDINFEKEMFLVYVVKVFVAESTTDSSTIHAEAPCPPTNWRERILVVT